MDDDDDVVDDDDDDDDDHEEELVSWCLKPSQPQRIISGL